MNLIKQSISFIIKYIIPFLIICIFLLQTSFIIYEYINYDGFDIFGRLDFVSGGPIKYIGDSTTWFQHAMIIKYNVYRLLTFSATILCIIDLLHRKKKVSAFALIVWGILLIFNMSFLVFLLQNKYLLSFKLYYETFITMQFITTKNFIISVFFIIYVVAIITYTVSYIRLLTNKIRPAIKSK